MADALERGGMKPKGRARCPWWDSDKHIAMLKAQQEQQRGPKRTIVPLNKQRVRNGLVAYNIDPVFGRRSSGAAAL